MSISPNPMFVLVNKVFLENCDTNNPNCLKEDISDDKLARAGQQLAGDLSVLIEMGEDWRREFNEIEAHVREFFGHLEKRLFSNHEKPYTDRLDYSVEAREMFDEQRKNQKQNWMGY